MADYIVRATAADGQIRAYAATTRDLVEHARDASGIEAMRNLFAEKMPGHSMRCEFIQQEEGLLGWGLFISPTT